MKEKFEFLEIINERQIMKVGSRFTNCMKEMQEYMTEKEKKNLYIMEFEEEEDEIYYKKIEKEYAYNG